MCTAQDLLVRLEAEPVSQSIFGSRESERTYFKTYIFFVILHVSVGLFFTLYLFTAYCSSENVFPHNKKNVEPMSTKHNYNEYFRVHGGGGGDF